MLRTYPLTAVAGAVRRGLTEAHWPNDDMVQGLFYKKTRGTPIPITSEVMRLALHTFADLPEVTLLEAPEHASVTEDQLAVSEYQPELIFSIKQEALEHLEWKVPALKVLGVRNRKTAVHIRMPNLSDAQILHEDHCMLDWAQNTGICVVVISLHELQERGEELFKS